MQRPADERLTHDTAREVCERLGVKAMLDGTIARARAELRADAERHRLPHRRLGGPRAARGDEPRGRARRARHDGLDDADGAGRVAAVDQAVRRADRAGDDAVAGGAEGVHAGRRRAAQGARARIGRVLQPGDRAGPRVRGRLHHAVDRLRQPRRVAAQRGVRPARLRSPEARQRARAAVHHLPVPRPRHRQPGRGPHARWNCGSARSRATIGRPTRWR